MKTDNELIAEFMGYKLITPAMRRNPETWSYSYWERERSHPLGKSIVGEKDLMYHASWDWLMPVVEKISNIWRENVDQQNKSTTIKERDFDNAASKVTMLSIDCGVNTAYVNVVEFIKWYNQHSK